MKCLHHFSLLPPFEMILDNAQWIIYFDDNWRPLRDSYFDVMVNDAIYVVMSDVKKRRLMKKTRNSFAVTAKMNMPVGLGLTGSV